jgi:tetratricopeptide (TPR) repeat protein
MDDQDLGWLIRDTSNRIRGPFKQAEVVSLIKRGQLKGKTELSRANSYWFAIEEKVELGRFLPEFNGGRPAPEAPTQMTATLTEADLRDHGVEITTFTPAPSPEMLKEGESSPDGKIEWLSDEFAEEFGDDFGTTISVQTDGSLFQHGSTHPAQEPSELEPEPEQPTPHDSAREEREKKNEMLRRATVKADTLPSEHKSFQGDRPKPIDTLMRTPGKPGGATVPAPQSATVSVPIEDGPAPKMFIEEEEPKSRERTSRRNFAIFVVVAIALVAGVGAAILSSRSASRPAAVERPKIRKPAEATAAARQAIAVHELEDAKSALNDLESESGARSEASTYLAQAVEKKEFLYDVEGAMLALQTARSQAHDKRTESEVDNLMAIYNFEHDPASSVELLRRNADSYKEDTVYRYNYALALLRTGKPLEAVGQLDGVLGNTGNDASLLEDASLAQAWALEAHCSAGARDAICKRAADAEDGYLRALSANPNSAKARLGLALFRLRRGGIKASDADFRAFIDLAPELDPFSRIVNFRKLGNTSFYDFAHAQIVDLNTPGASISKPSALIMASDAIVSCILGRTSEAGKILEGALSSAPGDSNVLKAIGYSKWKDGQFNELVDALKDVRDHNSFAVNLMLGKSFGKIRKRDLAEKYYRTLVETSPNRSEGFSLLGDLMLDQPERADEAKMEFQMALKKDPLDLLALRGLLKLNAIPSLPADVLKNIPF